MAPARGWRQVVPENFEELGFVAPQLVLVGLAGPFAELTEGPHMQDAPQQGMDGCEVAAVAADHWADQLTLHVIVIWVSWRDRTMSLHS